MSADRWKKRMDEQRKLLTKLYNNLSPKDRANAELVVQLSETNGLSITPTGSALTKTHYKDIDFFVMGSRNDARRVIKKLIESHGAKLMEVELDPLDHYMGVTVIEQYRLQMGETKIDIVYSGFSS